MEKFMLQVTKAYVPWWTESKRHFGTLRPLEPESHSDENVGSKDLSVPNNCLFFCACLLHSM